MMNESELKRYIRQQINAQLNVIKSGQAGNNNTVDVEDIDNLYPGSPTIVTRPVMAPYGFASRAPAKTIEVTAKVGSGPENQMVLGHRAADRPADLERGESSIYSSTGYELKAMLDGIRVVHGDKRFALLLGEDIIEFLGKLIDVIAIHTHGPPGSPPSNAADITLLKTEDLAGTTMLSTEDGGF